MQIDHTKRQHNEIAHNNDKGKKKKSLKVGEENVRYRGRMTIDCHKNDCNRNETIVEKEATSLNYKKKSQHRVLYLVRLLFKH